MGITSKLIEHCRSCGATLAPEVIGGVCPRCLARSVIEPIDCDLDRTFPRLFGDYELIEEIARGGMGVVYRARQKSLRRVVAVKMLLAGEFATREFVQRFRGEAATAGALRHPNIVAIHEVGVHDGQHFFCMDYVEGRNMAQVVGQHPLAPVVAARYVKQTAETIHFAHQHGILHRDLKPSNILIDENDQPRVTDFGLAKRLDQSVDLTMTGQVLGSPNFMPPEQADGKATQIGPASDVYSLGAILYHALTGRPPFLGETLHQVLRQTIESDPLPLRSLIPGVPQDLETICLKCLRKEPSGRYSSALALADDLGRFLHSEPIRARSISLAGRLWRWCHRKPAMAGLSVAFACAVGLGFAGVFNEFRRAENAEVHAMRELGTSYLEQARANRRSGLSGQRLASLEAIRSAVLLPVKQEALLLRNEAVAALALSDLRRTRQFPGTNQAVGRVLSDPRVERFAWIDSKGGVHVSRFSDERNPYELAPVGTNAVLLASFSQEGRWLAVTYADSRTLVWDLNSHQVGFELKGTKGLGVVEFSPSGEQLVASGPDRSIRFYALPEGEFMKEIVFDFVPWSIDYSFDGQFVSVTAFDEPFVLVIDVETGRRRGLWHGASVNSLAWHPRENRIAVGCSDFSIYNWDVANREFKRIITDHQSRITDVAWHPNVDLLLSCSWDGTMTLWNPVTGKRVATALSSASAPRFSSDGERLALVGEHQIDLWEIVPNLICRFAEEPAPVSGNPRGGPWNVQFSPDGRVLASASFDGVRLWDAVTARELAHLPSLRGCSSVLFSPNQTNLIASGGSGVHAWPIVPAQDGNTWELGPSREISRETDSGYASISTNGEWLAYAHGNSLSVRSNEQRVLRLPQANPRAVVVSPDGNWIASSARNNSETKLWAAQSGQLVWTRTPLPKNQLIDLAFTPDGTWLVTGGGSEFQFWKVTTGEPGPRVLRTGTGNFHGPVAFTQDGRTMALALTRTLIQLRDMTTGQELVSLESSNPQLLSGLSFDPSGTRLAACGENHVIQVWDLRELRAELRSVGLDWPGPAYAPPLLHPGPPAIQLFAEDLMITPREPDKDGKCVDLTRFYTGSLLQLLKSEPDNSIPITPGFHTLGGVTYDIRGVVALRSALVSFLPRSAKEIPVHRICKRLHFLHGSGWDVPRGTCVATLIVHYKDGRKEEMPLRYGAETANWWVRTGQSPPGVEVVWTGVNARAERDGLSCALFHTAWENPRPNMEVDTVDCVSSMTPGLPFLVALTID